ncbi:D-tyrosyl-tRNA(Tyr) deacylase [Thalassovita litoralis]|jgi:D-tyrosyl-tRNA(Tyr) deacylase|uniref:D-aminoacyl-tRNA deacylase n=1 Tax=Thalassovita litoralis TaxID=1010611 RepID=A0A521DM29_9RHOB|nr:D-aminoacyl-tRNA deacylase [Thalassovita litoralis]SMO72688.1 D-tyrosyl-tRNA(Tyr) deacylase [Thalassovita litoralis]
MRALLQRVTEASVTVDGQVIGQTGPGLLILICAMSGDTEAQADHLAAKIAKLRIFKDDAGKMNRSLRDVGGSALVVSQFTLAADTSRGNRPGFSTAAPPEQGKRLYEYFARQLQAQEIPVETGEFGADMAVALVNDGPITIWMEAEATPQA